MLLIFATGVAQAAEFTGINKSIIDNQLLLTPQFKLPVSQKVIEAINNGIVITFVIQTRLINQVDWWFDETVANKNLTFQVRYFSLSGQYQLHNTQTKLKQSFVSLEQLLLTLSTKSQFSFKQFADANQFSTRIFLDKQALPSTMQLPTVFDSDWNINSDWHTEKISLAANNDQVP